MRKGGSPRPLHCISSIPVYVYLYTHLLFLCLYTPELLVVGEAVVCGQGGPVQGHALLYTEHPHTSPSQVYCHPET